MLRILMFKAMIVVGLAGFALTVDFKESRKRNPDLTLENYIEVRWALAKLLIQAQSADAERRASHSAEVRLDGDGADPTPAAADSVPKPDDTEKGDASLLQKPQFGGFGTCRIDGGRKTCSISDG
jgi:hypothetical protein